MADSSSTNSNTNSLTDVIAQISSSMFQVSKSVSLIERQPITESTQVENLALHQQNAKDQAKAWSDSYESMVGTLVDIKGFAIYFSSVMTELLRLADILDSGSEEEQAEAKDQVLTILVQGVVKDLKARQITISKTQKKVDEFADSFKDLFKDLQEDFNAAEVAIADDKDAIDSKNSDLSDAKDSMRKYETLIAVSSVTGAAGGFKLGVALIAGEGTLVANVLSGIVILASAISLSVTVENYINAVKKYYSILDDIRKLQEDIVELSITEDTISDFITSVESVKDVLPTLSTAWDTILSKFNAVIADAEEAQAAQLSNLIRGEILDMSKDWESTGSAVNNGLPSGNVYTMVEYSSMDDYLADLQAKTLE